MPRMGAVESVEDSAALSLLTVSRSEHFCSDSLRHRC